MEKIKQKRSEKIFVYQLKDGLFYKMHRKGAWSYADINKKDISCKFIDQADKFSETSAKEFSTPYNHKALEGGRWVEIKVTPLYEEI